MSSAIGFGNLDFKHEIYRNYTGVFNMNIIEGDLIGAGQKHGIIVARWNEFITERLLEGALDALRRHGVAEEDITLVRVPGSFEIGSTAKVMADSGKFDAISCIGAVIRGATPHFDYVSGQTAGMIAGAGVQSGIPVIFGVLTTDTIEQAIERAGTKAGNKGYETGVVAIEMASLNGKLKKA